MKGVHEARRDCVCGFLGLAGCGYGCVVEGRFDGLRGQLDFRERGVLVVWFLVVMSIS